MWVWIKSSYTERDGSVLSYFDALNKGFPTDCFFLDSNLDLHTAIRIGNEQSTDGCQLLATFYFFFCLRHDRENCLNNLPSNPEKNYPEPMRSVNKQNALSTCNFSLFHCVIEFSFKIKLKETKKWPKNTWAFLNKIRNQRVNLWGTANCFIC